ncbi:MAG: hypothetical protein ACOY3I_09945 [Verrucomicrobiota bacterium]
MKPLIVIGSVIAALILCLVIGGRLVSYFQGELGTRPSGHSVSQEEMSAMNHHFEKKQEELDEQYQRASRAQNIEYYSEDATFDIPIMRDDDPRSLTRKVTFKELLTKMETWLTLGSIIFLGWVLWLRLRSR